MQPTDTPAVEAAAREPREAVLEAIDIVLTEAERRYGDANRLYRAALDSGDGDLKAQHSAEVNRLHAEYRGVSRARRAAADAINLQEFLDGSTAVVVPNATTDRAMVAQAADGGEGVSNG